MGNNKEIYLDNSATTKVCQKSIDAVINAMQNDYGNATSLHRKGFEAEKLIINAKKEISKALMCNENEIFFTSGATESNNMAIIGSVLANKRRGKKIITTAIEHSSVLESTKFLESMGYEIVRIKPNENGEFLPLDFFNAVDDNTVLVSAMFVNNETGTILPVCEIAKAVKAKNKQTIFHTDAVQGFLKIPLKVKNTDIDLLSFSGHKIYAPKGIGALYIKKGTKIQPLLYGGGQQNGIRVGTDSVPLISGLGQAVAEILPQREKLLSNYKELKTYLISMLENNDNVIINSKQNDAPYIVNISVKKIRSEIMLHYLEQFNIYVSSGSACSKGANSHVLSAFGYSKDRIDTALRISFSKDTTKEDLEFFVEKLNDGINSLAKMK